MKTKQPKTLYGWEWETYRAVIIAALLLSALAVLAITVERAKKAPSEPLGQTIVAKVEANEPSEDYYRQEPLRYIRWKGQQEGYDDFTISKFIRIARSESGFNLDPHAKNPKSTATGIYQFTHGTFHRYCKGKNVYDFVDNIDCFYKVLEIDGYPEGLRHWNASRFRWDRVNR